MANEIAPAYDLIGSSPVLSAADHERIRKGLLLPMLTNIDKYKAGKSNWQSWHNAGMLWAAPLVGDAAWAQKAIADPQNGFVRQMEISVSDDGMWHEGSIGYHFYSLRAMVTIAEGAARRLEIDLWSHPKLKKMFTLPVDYVMPDGTLPRFGDGGGATIAAAAAEMEYAYHAYRDAAMLPYLPARRTWETVMFGREPGPASGSIPPPRSKLFDSTGQVILRNGGEAGLTAAMIFSPDGGSHSHYDKLSFVLFGHGRELGVDRGSAASQAYRLPIHRNWYKATISHNTVMVDGKSQQPGGGKIECFGYDAELAAAVARCEKGYPGTVHRRMLCLTPTYLLVFDDLKSDVPHRFDWLFHHRGTGVACDAARKDDRLPGDIQGQEYVEHVKSGAAVGPVTARFETPGVTTHLTMNAAPDSEVRTGDGPGSSVLGRVPLIMLSAPWHRAPVCGGARTGARRSAARGY